MKYTKDQKFNVEVAVRNLLYKEYPKIWFKQHSRTRSQLPKPIIELFCIYNNDIYQLTRSICIFLDLRLDKKENGIICSFGTDGYELVMSVSEKLFSDYKKIQAIRM